METIKDLLERVAVRIEDTSEKKLGSGILWLPLNSQYVYVFTAAHVIKGNEGNILICLLQNMTQEDILLGDIVVCDVKCHDDYDPSKDKKESDVAVIRIKKPAWMDSMPHIVFGEMPRNGQEVLGRGFPTNAEEKDLYFSGQELIGITSNSKLNRFQMTLKMGINPSDRDGELEGYSGTGIFRNSDNVNELVLLGIFSYGQGNDATQGTTNAFSVNLITQICEENNWDIPEQYNEAPRSFEPYIDASTDIIEKMQLKTEMREFAQDLVCDDVTPRNLITKVSDCYNIPQCHDTRLRCQQYWISKLQLLIIMRIMGVTDYVLNNLSVVINKNGESISLPIEFICSEGVDGKSTMQGFVHSLVLEEYEWNKKLRNNGLIIWSSAKVPIRRVTNKKLFRNLVGNICNDRTVEFRRRRFSIKYGECPPDELPIIHIHEFLERIASIDEDNRIINDIKNCVEELFINAIS